MPTKLKREDDIDSAYDYSPTAQRLSDSENATSDNYTDTGIDQAEAFANDPNNATSAIRARETSATDDNGGWTVNRSGTSTPKKVNGAVKILKRGGPVGAIIGILLSLAGIVSFFGGPGLLIVNLAEIMTEKFNYQLASMDIRSDRIIKAKLNNTTSGVCGKISIRCKYSTFSNREVKNFEKAGFKVNTDSKSVLGRNKITSLELDGKTIVAKDFAKELKNNPGFREATRRAFNPKFVGMSDKIFNKVAQKIGVSKKAPFEEDMTDEERAKAVEEDTKNGRGSTSGVDCEPSKCTEEQKNNNSSTEKANKLGEVASDGLNQGAEILSQADDIESAVAKGGTSALENIGGAASSIIKITGPIDNTCMVYGWIKTISLTAKAIRMVQMARYAMTFLTTASMIKAGTARPADVAYLGTLMTKVTKDSKGKLSKSATDSFGYRYAAYGDKGIDTNASPYIAGASFGGKIQQAVNKIIGSYSREKLDSTCHILANPLVQAGSLIVGVASFFFGAGEAKLGIQAAMAPVLAVASMFLPAMIGDILAGNLVDKNTYGEATGNIITAGTGGMLSKVASSGGNAIMHPSDAKSYMQLQNTVLAQYADYDRQTLSPFDTSSPNTFLGSIYTRFVPYINQSTASTYGALASIGSIVGSTFSNIATTKTFADDTESFTECSDMSYRDLDIATDPFCNPVVGIPPKYLDDNPNTINDRLLAKDMIDDETGEPKGDTYTSFISDCVDRENPYGSSADGEVDNTKKCFIDSQEKADMYVHYIDQRNLDVMENGLPETGTATTGGGEFVVASYNILHAASHPEDSKNIGNCPTAGDSQECIKLRSDRQIEIIRGGAGNPAFDIVGTQETSPDQYTYIKNTMTDYSVYPDSTQGMNNNDNGAVAVWWNNAKLRKFDAGHAPGLSNTSKPINNPWVGLQDTNGNKMYVMSIHYANSTFGGTPETIRKSSQLTMDWVKSKVSPSTPVIVMGDFNDQPKEKLSYCVYTQNSLMQHALDMQRGADPSEACPNPDKIGGIDHVYATTTSNLTASGWTHMEDTGVVKLASDHTPVYTKLTWPGGNTSSSTMSGNVAWPVDKKFFDKDPADFLGSHILSTGTAWGADNMGTSGKGAGIAADIGNPPDGTPVYSMLDGTVTSTNLCGANDGIAIKSTSPSGATIGIAYMHGTSQQFKVGDKVKAGQHILNMGAIGCNVYGGHVHIGIAVNGKYICPQDVFKAMSKGETPDFAAYVSKANAGCGGRG
jgi:endonuclease/exonuclease/phosphatase family metal-dependent hydrolase